MNGIAPSHDGINERQRLDVPTRFKMFVAQTQSANYEVSGHPVVESEFAMALEMAKVKQLDRIADLLEQVIQQLGEKGRRQ